MRRVNHGGVMSYPPSNCPGDLPLRRNEWARMRRELCIEHVRGEDGLVLQFGAKALAEIGVS